VTHVTSYLTFQSSTCSKLTDTWCTSHVSMSSPVMSASHVTLQILGSTSPLHDIIVPHHFDSSGFGTSRVSTLEHFQFSRTLISRTGQIDAMCLPYWTTHINHELRDFGCYRYKDQQLQFLRAFRLWKTQNSTFFRNVFIRSSRYTDACFPWIEGYDFFGSSYFGELNSQPSLFPEVRGLLLRVLLDQTIAIHFRSSGFGNLNSQLLLAHLFSECFHPEHTIDLCVSSYRSTVLDYFFSS
jgi:hypothetical protein